MAVPSMIYATTPRRNELYVNLYTNATSTLHLGGHKLLRSTKLPTCLRMVA